MAGELWRNSKAGLGAAAGSDRFWIGVIFGYFLLQLVVRCLVGHALELDEAEALWFATDLHLGYGPQPPLYFWLQWAVFQVLGPSILSLALLKAVLLSASFILLFKFLRREAIPPRLAGTVVLSFALLPDLSWEAQRALTHTVLVFFVSVWALSAAVRALRSGGWRDHAVLGLCFGAGVLSKPNFGFLVLGILAAPVFVPELRSRWQIARQGLALIIGVVVASPLALFALTNPHSAGASIQKLEIATDRGAATLLASFWGFFIAIAGALALFLIVAGVLWLFRSRPAAPVTTGVRFIALASALALALFLVGELVIGATETRQRWLAPLIWPIAVLVMAWLLPQLTPRLQNGFALGAGAIWLLIVPALTYASLVNPGYRNADFDPLLTRIPKGAVVASESTWLLGNLKLLHPPFGLVLGGADLDPARWPGGTPRILIQGAETGPVLPQKPGDPERIDIAHGKRTQSYGLTFLRAGS